MATQDPALFEILSRLVLGPGAPFGSGADEGVQRLATLSKRDMKSLLALSDSHHVVLRALEVVRRCASAAENPNLSSWAARAIENERCRIDGALAFLESIGTTLEREGCRAIVIKSLDHWPDLGSDLDLYTNAPAREVIRIMMARFGASLAPRSWGDRLAAKWNFLVPGLGESVEVHVGRLGQTGEHVGFAREAANRSILTQRGVHTFRVPRAEDRLIITTLQRMYRHFYLRLCDIADTMQLLETQSIDFLVLRSTAEAAGIWPGVATFLCIVCDYAAHYGGDSFNLPRFVRSAALLDYGRVCFRRGFLRVPIVPEAASLYASQLARFTWSRKVGGTLRLSLLPCLATAAVLAERITGSDKGIW